MIGEILKRMIGYFGADARRINHALKVYGFAKCIGEAEGLSSAKLQILEASAVLHDIGIKLSEEKYNSAEGKYQELEGPPVARDILTELRWDKAAVDRVCFLIGNHHSYGNIDDKDFQILVEADFLVNIFEDDMSTKQISSIRDKYFKTKAGVELVNSMYVK